MIPIKPSAEPASGASPAAALEADGIACTVGDELFLIRRREDLYYLYSPLTRTVASLNTGAARLVSRYLRSECGELSAEDQDLLRSLRESQLLDVEVKRPLYPRDLVFQPHEVTLFLTSRCNLRCRYCYAHGGDRLVDMPWDVAQAAIDLVSRNAGLLGSRQFVVAFHGGGEPTVAWSMLTRCVDYAQQRAAALGLDAEFFIATNGVFGDEQRQFLAKTMQTVNISFDGTREAQDHNRPHVSGKGSYDDVVATMQYFHDCHFPFGVRITVTHNTVLDMPRMVRQLLDRFNVSYLHVEPVWRCGRCLVSNEVEPEDETFIDSFVQAHRLARNQGVELQYSGARLGSLVSTFCAAPGHGFTVLPEGIATSCYEVTKSTDPRARVFHYGGYDDQSGGFQFDYDQIARLREYSVDRIPHCRACFCKWHCAGDCLAKILTGATPQEAHTGSRRCRLNRELTLSLLDQRFEARE